MTQFVSLGGMTADHINQKTHVAVQVWEIVAGGLKRRLNTYELTFDGALLDINIIKPAVRDKLVAAGVVAADVDVLTQAESRQ